jgi:hypothetical protein
VPVAEGEDEDVDPRVAARRKRQAEARAARAKARADRAGGADGATGSAPAAAEGAGRPAATELRCGRAEPTARVDRAEPTAAEPSPADTRPRRRRPRRTGRRTREHLDVRQETSTRHRAGRGHRLEIVGDGEFATADMSLSIGPAHPATHGVFRIVLELDGERVKARTPVIGYMHRGFEKLAEHRDYRQIMALVNRHDWLSGFSNELGVALAVEQMMEMEVPERAQWIRMLIAEWNRILNHLMFIGSYALELGAITPMFYAFREREDIQHLLESATGGRLHFTYNQVGGLKIDLPKGFLKRLGQMSPCGALPPARLRRPGPRQRDLPRPHQGRRPAAAGRGAVVRRHRPDPAGHRAPRGPG